MLLKNHSVLHYRIQVMHTDELLTLLKEQLEPLGLEVYLFKSNWYNEKVAEPFKFQVCDNTVCAVVISTPFFFEKSFISYVKSLNNVNLTKDPMDSCIAYHLDQLKSSLLLNKLSMTVMYDYEILPNRRPKVLVQTAAHVSGAAYYYKHCSIKDFCPGVSIATDSKVEQEKDLRSKNKKIFGVCIHPNFGGWFAIRAVIIFDTLVDPDLKYTPPVDCVPTREGRIKLLDSFNMNWQDWSYRDIIPTKAQYSDLQKEYFSTLPKNRQTVLSKILST